MPIRIAIPEPTSTDTEYNARSLPPYCESLRAAGAEPVVISLKEPPSSVAKLLAEVQGILLPGSGFDVAPELYGEERIPECGEADAGRAAIDELLLQDAFDLQKPILGICHGTQTLNVWRKGKLVQDLKTAVNHSPGRQIAEAHTVEIAPGSRLSRLSDAAEPAKVNSSHHQAVRVPGDKLRITAISGADGVIEAVELDSPDHFVLGVQWHPERTYEQSSLSRSIFAAFVAAAENWHPRPVGEKIDQR